MENSIMTIQRNENMTAHNFKSATIKNQIERINSALATADAAVGKIKQEYDKARDEAYKAIAPIVASLKANKAHETEGFKTFSEFAEACLPISKRQISTLLAYQKKIADVPALSEFSVSNVEAIAPADAVAIKKGIEDGTISNETSQDDLKQFAKAHPRAVSGSGRPTVVPTFDIYTELAVGEESQVTVFASNAIKDDFASVLASFADSNIGAKPLLSFFTFKDEKGGTVAKCVSALHVDGVVNTYRYRPYIKPKAEAKPEKAKPSVYDTLRAQFDFMAEWSDEQIAATLRANADKAKGN